MKKVKVETTVEVLGKKLTRSEAEALYHELKRELKMVEPVTTVPVPVPYRIYEHQPIRPWIYGDGTSTTTSTGAIVNA